MDIIREWVTPDVTLAFMVEEDCAHAGFGRVGGSKEGRRLWDDLCQVRRPVAEAGGERGKSINVGSQALVDADSISFGLVKGEL